MTARLYNDQEKVRYRYDRCGSLYEKQDLSTGISYQYDYDLTGRVLGVAASDGTAYRYTYDQYNRISRLKTSNGNVTDTTEYLYGDGTEGQKIGLIYGIRQDGIQRLGYTYDGLSRLTTRTLYTTTPFVTEYGYLEGAAANRTTSLVKTVKNGMDTLEYTYDKLGNITGITKNGTLQESYTYDGLSQLKTVARGEDTWEYTYDNGGNLLTVQKNGTAVKTYSYTDENWKDKLTSYNGRQLTYDAIGNPLTYRDGMAFTWQYGRRLVGISTFQEDGTGEISYGYNADGLRTHKTVNGETTEYDWLEGVLLGQKTGDKYLTFFYDESGTAYGFRMKNGTTEASYYYEFNLQGDVIGIIDSAGTRVVEYAYGAWGEELSVTGTMADTIGQKNPLRYRGYYYDGETGFYYLGSRYYDPEVGRFLNADGYVATGQGILGTNMFAYCGNNPVNREDPTGHLWSELWEFVRTAASEIGAAISNLAPAYAGCGGAAVADGPLPFGDALAITGAALLTVGAIGYGIYQTSKSTAEKTRAKGKAVAIPQAKKKRPTVIYRYYSSKTENLAPRQGIDYDGLSFSTKPPRPGVSAVVTTVEQVNFTGILKATLNEGTHVTITPVNGTVEQWMKQGQSSIWTRVLSAIVVEWDGGN